MVKVTLVYPFFKPFHDNSLFRFPPLGLGYIAASLRNHGVEVDLVDCTFSSREEAFARIKSFAPQVIGFYSMFSMKRTTIEMGRQLQNDCDLLIVGGPLPTLEPQSYLDVFDVAVIGEGEETMAEVIHQFSSGTGFSGVKGIVFNERGKVRTTASRKYVEDLDSLPFPARDLFDNDAYKQHYLRRFGYSISPMMTSRGCPFSCDFCSRPVFGESFRSRSASSVLSEFAEIAGLGYDRVWFADDCFTLNRKRLFAICEKLERGHFGIGWECLSRVDTMDREVAAKMRSAGCIRVFFGIESGTNAVLSLMNKQTTIEQAKRAVETAKRAGLQTGAFFILGYPGENNKTILDTVRFATNLPLDYLSFTLPYPIPGTALFERVKHNGGFSVEDWEETKNWSLIRHQLLYHSGFSEAKLKFAIGKAQLQFYGRKYLGKRGYNVIGAPFERVTDSAFSLMR